MKKIKDFFIDYYKLILAILFCVALMTFSLYVEFKEEEPPPYPDTIEDYGYLLEEAEDELSRYKEDGWYEHYDEVYNEGYDDGYDSGYEDGYIEGYSDAIAGYESQY